MQPILLTRPIESLDIGFLEHPVRGVGDSRRSIVSTHQNPQLKRTNLFLVRLWNEGTSDEEENSTGEVEWHGRVQRVIDGEAYRFDNLQGLVDLLLKMLSESRGESPDSQRDFP